jgi:hypothetical protein
MARIKTTSVLQNRVPNKYNRVLKPVDITKNKIYYYSGNDYKDKVTKAHLKSLHLDLEPILEEAFPNNTTQPYIWLAGNKLYYCAKDAYKNKVT